jgi:hypothetical protein
MNNELKMALEGVYKVAIVDATGDEIWRQPEWKKNLILNQGMDELATQYLSQISTHGIAGTGSIQGGITQENYILSGESSASIIEGGLKLFPQPGGIQNFDTEIWNGWTGSLANGDMIKFADGTEVKVGSVSTTTAGVIPTDTVLTQSFTIWKTSQTKLQGEVKRSSTYLSGVGNCGSSINLNNVSYLRTYDFSIETSPKIYTEVGVGWSSTVGSATAFSRIVLPQTVSIDTNQRLRLVYQLNVAFSPTASQYVGNAIISGWPVAPSTNTNMSQSIQQMWVSSISTTGASSPNYAALEPASAGSNCQFFGSTNSQSLVTFGVTPIDRDSNGVAVTANSTLDIYVNGSYTQYKNATWPLASLNYQNIRSFGFGVYYGSYPWYTSYGTSGQAFAMVFEQNQSKYNTQTLTMAFRWTWSRVLA